jgi:hypothetical protein
MFNNGTKVYLGLILILFPVFLGGCGSQVEFIAPPIDPPADLIPGYVPEGFVLISGFQMEPDESLMRFINRDVGDRVLCEEKISLELFNFKSPLGEKIQGVHYQNGDKLLLITRSYFPSGTLKQWQERLENPPATHCECDSIRLGVDGWLPFRNFHIEELRTIGNTQVAILSGGVGTLTIFIRGDDLIVVEGGIDLEENLRVVESLLAK